LQIFSSYSEFLNALILPLKLQNQKQKQRTLSQTKFYGYTELHSVLFCVQLSSGQHNLFIFFLHLIKHRSNSHMGVNARHLWLLLLHPSPLYGHLFTSQH